MIAILDFGIGNLSSIKKMLDRLQYESIITSDIDTVNQAEKIILPGVGKFDYGMAQLKEAKLLDVLNEKVLVERTPILGICLGFQMLSGHSEEGHLPGLGWIPGKTVKFEPSKLEKFQKVPHMGWTDVRSAKKSKLMEGMFPDPRFYFVHSYHMLPENNDHVLLEANYGYNFTAGVEYGNILGVQFHPEKSHKYGLKLLENFAKNY